MLANDIKSKQRQLGRKPVEEHGWLGRQGRADVLVSPEPAANLGRARAVRQLLKRGPKRHEARPAADGRSDVGSRVVFGVSF